MFKFGLCLLLLALSRATIIQEDVPADLKIAVSFDTIDTIKTSTIGPTITGLAQGFKVPQLPLVTKGPFTVNISNMVVSNFSVDWTNTRLLELDSSNQLTVSLQGISVGLEFDTDISFYLFKQFDYSAADNSVLITDLNIDLSLGFSRLDDGQIFAYIASKPTIHMQDVQTHLTFSKLQDIINFGEMVDLSPADIGNAFTAEMVLLMNSTIVAKSAQALFSAFNTVHQNIMINSTAPETPYTFSTPTDDYLVLALDFTLTNLETGDVAAGPQPAAIPNYVEDALPMQIIMSEGLIERGIWATFQSPSVDITLSEVSLKTYLTMAAELIGVVGLNETQVITEDGYMVMASEFIVPSL